MKELKVNDPVMWRKREYRFVRYPSQQRGQIGILGTWDEAVIVTVGGTDRHWFTVPVSELDLIMEFDICKTLD
jgi:hypothetical protein